MKRPRWGREEGRRVSPWWWCVMSACPDNWFSYPAVPSVRLDSAWPFWKVTSPASSQQSAGVWEESRAFSPQENQEPTLWHLLCFYFSGAGQASYQAVSNPVNVKQYSPPTSPHLKWERESVGMIYQNIFIKVLICLCPGVTSTWWTLTQELHY